MFSLYFVLSAYFDYSQFLNIELYTLILSWLWCPRYHLQPLHSSDFSIYHIRAPLLWRHRGAMVSQITSLTIVYSTVDSGADQRKHQSSASLVLCGEFTDHRGIPAQMASNPENVSIWWRHHDSIRSQAACGSSHHIVIKKALPWSL